jgi:hypothetical protein
MHGIRLLNVGVASVAIYWANIFLVIPALPEDSVGLPSWSGVPGVPGLTKLAGRGAPQF